MKNKIPYLILATILLLIFILVTNSGPKVNAQENLIWTGNAYSATGLAILTPTLTLGTTYHIVASEVFNYNFSGGLEADAQYYTTATDTWNWTNHYPAPNGHSFLQMNGNDANWGAFSNGDTNHQYSITYIGQAAPISFQVYDWIDQDISNNYCHIVVSIYETQSAPAPTPSPTPTATPAPTPTPSPTPTPTPTPSPTPTPITQTVTPTQTVAPTPLSASAFCSVTVMKGQAWYFFVQNIGGVWPYTFQWYEGNTLIAGQTDMVLMITKTTTGTYSYYCTVTDSQGTKVTTNTVTLTVV